MSDPDGATGQHPADADAHYNRGITLAEQGKLDEAITEFREAIRLQPDFSPAHSCLTAALRRKGEFTEALSVLREVRDFGKAEAEKAQGVHAAPDAFGFTQIIERSIAEFEPLAELEKKLPSVLSGQARPASVAETLAVAQLCSEKKLHAASARFWAEAFQSDRRLADPAAVPYRYYAACEAVLAGSGQGKADPPLDRAAQARLRRQALDWLKAELAAWDAGVGGNDPQALEEAAWAVGGWKMQPDLAGVRDPDALARLPEAERKDWQALWADVVPLLIRIHRATIRLYPDDEAVHFQLGNALREQGELNEAIDAYREVIRLRPGAVEAHTSLGIALTDQGKLEDAIAEFARRSGSIPTTPGLTTTSERLWQCAERGMRRSSNTARRSGSTRATQSTATISPAP